MIMYILCIYIHMCIYYCHHMYFLFRSLHVLLSADTPARATPAWCPVLGTQLLRGNRGALGATRISDLGRAIPWENWETDLKTNPETPGNMNLKKTTASMV